MNVDTTHLKRQTDNQVRSLESVSVRKSNLQLRNGGHSVRLPGGTAVFHGSK